VTECNDGIDNDGDGLIDWQFDLGCANADDATEASGPRDQEGGFTTFDVGADSKLVYVSSSTGDDANDGSSPSQAVATLSRGADLVRDGENDFMLLRRGDAWRGEKLGRFKSGKDAAHPLVIASYGDSTDRPRVEVNANFIDHGGAARSFVSVIGLEIISFPKIPNDPEFDGATGGGFRYVGGGEGLLIEGCHLVYGEVVVQSYGDSHYDGVEVRRNVIERSYHVDTCGQNAAHRPSGMYASHVNNLTIEGNVFDHNGWNEDVASACATMYNHNMYLNANGLVVRDNIIARASSMGIKMRSDSTGDADDLVFENNLLVDGEIGIGIGGNTSEPARFSNVTIRNNVFSEVGIGNPTNRNFSWMLSVTDNVHATIENNYPPHQPWYTNAFGIALEGGSTSDITVAGNLFYDLKARSLRIRPQCRSSMLSLLRGRDTRGNPCASPCSCRLPITLPREPMRCGREAPATCPRPLVQRGVEVTGVPIEDAGPLMPTYRSGVVGVESVLRLTHVFQKAGDFDLVHDTVGFAALPFAGFITTPILSTVWFEMWKHAADMYQEMNQRVFYVAPSEQDRKAGLLYTETLPWGVPVQSAPFHAIADDHLVFLGALRPKAGVEEAIEVARLADRTLVLLGAVQDRVFFDRHVAPHLGERLRHHEDPASPEADRLIGQAVGVVHVGGGAGMQQLALLDAHKAHANLILMGPGSLYDDPDGLLSGSGTLGRHLKVTKLEALPQDAVRAWLRVAAEHARRT
jgi:hypothetical protein